MGLGEGITGCGCGLSAPKLGISKRLSRSLESLRPRSRSRRQGVEGSVNPVVDKYAVCQSMNDVASERKQPPVRALPWDVNAQKENRMTRSRGGSFGRGMLQRSSSRRRKVGPEPGTSDQ